MNANIRTLMYTLLATSLSALGFYFLGFGAVQNEKVLVITLAIMVVTTNIDIIRHTYILRLMKKSVKWQIIKMSNIIKNRIMVQIFQILFCVLSIFITIEYDGDLSFISWNGTSYILLVMYVASLNFTELMLEDVDKIKKGMDKTIK